MENAIVENIFNVSWIAVIVGFIASFALGALWYSPKLFGVKWAEGSKVELKDSDQMPMTPMITQALGTFFMSWFVAITASIEHLLTLIIALIAFALIKFASAGFTQKTDYAAYTETGFILAMGVVMIIANAIF